MPRGTPLLVILLAFGSCTVSWDELGREAEYVDFSRSEESAGEKTLRADVELKVGQIEIQPGTGSKLYELNLHYNELAFEPKVEFRRSGSAGELAVRLEGEGKSFRGLGNNVLNLTLSPDVPLELETNTGVGECTIDLSGMTVSSLVLQSGVGETKLNILEPNRGHCSEVEILSGVGALEVIGLGNLAFERLEFRGGIGGTTLDFSGSWDQIGEVRITVGVGGVEIRLPREIGAEVQVSKGFLSGVEMPEFRKSGDTYYSENLDRVDKTVRFSIKAGIGNVELEWI